MNRELAISKIFLENKLEAHHAFFNNISYPGYLCSTKIYAPSVAVQIKQKNGNILTSCDNLYAGLVNPDVLIEEIENYDYSKLNDNLILEGQYIVSAGQGDCIPLALPHPKIPWLEAILGCPIKMLNGQIWNERYPYNPESLLKNNINCENNSWFQLYLEFIQRLQLRLGNRFPISAMSLFRGPSDLAAAIIGVEEACIGWLENPSFMARLMGLCTDVFLSVAEAGNKMLKKSNIGYPSKWGLWSPDYVVDIQEDHSCLLSPEIYRKQILPYDLEIINNFPKSVFHIHNNGLQVVPCLLDIPGLDVIEVTIDPYPMEESRKLYELEKLKEILKYKALIIEVNFPNIKEYNWLIDNLPKEKLFFKSFFNFQIYRNLPEDFPGKRTWLYDDKR